MVVVVFSSNDSIYMIEYYFYVTILLYIMYVCVV